MLKPDTIFCPYCCKTHTVPFYTDGIHPIGVYLHYRGSKYMVVEHPIPNPNNPDDVPDYPVGIQLTENVDPHKTGLPEKFEVFFPDTPQPVMMWRTCPECFHRCDRTGLGTLPTFVIGMVGCRSSGKSAFLNSIAFPQHVADVNRAQHPYLLAIEPRPHIQGLSEATLKMGRGMTKLLTIRHRSNNHPVAHVVLLDVSGELFGDTKGSTDGKQAHPTQSVQDLAHLSSILAGTAGYTGVDAVIFTDPIPGAPVSSDADPLRFNAATVMSNCSQMNMSFNDIPLAYVFTHLDYYFDKMQDFPRYRRDGNDTRNYPLASAYTFAFQPDEHARAKLVDRIYIEDNIARSLPSFVPADRNKDITKGFLVSSCKCENVDGLGFVEDYTYSRNVMDPLLWILNKLRIFPLTR